MELINFESLNSRKEEIKKDYQSKTPFRYVMFENFFFEDKADLIYQN
jgi:hypothetical protein